MSAIGPKRTFHYVAFYVAFGGKADMVLCQRKIAGVTQANRGGKMQLARLPAPW